MSAIRSKNISRRKALEAATQVIFYRRSIRNHSLTLDRILLQYELEDMGFGPVTPAEMSDIWRHSTYFESVE